MEKRLVYRFKKIGRSAITNKTGWKILAPDSSIYIRDEDVVRLFVKHFELDEFEYLKRTFEMEIVHNSNYRLLGVSFVPNGVSIGVAIGYYTKCSIQKIFENVLGITNLDSLPFVFPEEAIDVQNDIIKNPAHYTDGRKYEPKDVIRDWALNFNLGCAVKYLSRAGRKGDAIEDLKKAKQYIDFEIDALKKEGEIK